MERSIPFIKRVRLENYKSIESCDVRLSPLTVLIGPNGSGKSNFLDALSFVARALDTNLSTAIDERGGLPELLRRVPYATDSFSIELAVATLWGSLPVTGNYGLTIGRHGGTSFEVVREDCDLQWNGNRGSWRRQGSSVREGSGPPVAIIEPDRLYLPLAGSQLPAGGLPGGPTTTVPTPFSELVRGLRGMRFYSLGLDELRQPKPKSAGALLGHHGEYLADIVGTLARDHREHKERLDAYLAAVLGAAEPGGAGSSNGPPVHRTNRAIPLSNSIRALAWPTARWYSGPRACPTGQSELPGFSLLYSRQPLSTAGFRWSALRSRKRRFTRLLPECCSTR